METFLMANLIPYPTSYAEFMDFFITTITEQSPNCPAGQQEISSRCECVLTSWLPYPLEYLDTTVVSLPKAYYTVLDSCVGMND